MKKFYLFCLFLIILGVVVNAVLYVRKMNSTPQAGSNNAQSNYGTFDDGRPPLNRPIAYMINNVQDALPQSGIYGADYVYEMLVEGGLTRLMAVYTKGGVDKIGPIRSARHNFLDLSMEYDAIYAHFGGSPRAFEDIAKLSIPSLNGIKLDGVMYWREKTRKAPHNAYTNIDKTVAQSKKLGYDKSVAVNHFRFNKNDVTIDGTPASNIFIPFSYSQNTSYEYDANSKTYKRYMRRKPHIDELINSQLTAKNIIIQFAKNTTMDDENRQDIYLVAAGKGYYITDGKAEEINWEKKSRQDKTYYYDKSGKEISLNKGQTWIHIVPIGANVTIK